MKKVVLVTGGSGDIGKEICREFFENDYIVAVQYFSDKITAENLCDELNAQKEKRAFPFMCDIRDEKSVITLVDLIYKQFGKIDVLINNAGISQIKLFDCISLEDWNNMLAVNLTGTFLATRECVKKMLPQKSGSIINISSIWGQVGASCETHYSAAKGGMIALTKALSKELAPSAIRVNCLCPGVIDTKMNGHLTQNEMKELREEIPMGRLGTGRDIGELCLFLGEKGKYITGEVIGINGGFC